MVTLLSQFNLADGFQKLVSKTLVSETSFKTDFSRAANLSMKSNCTIFWLIRLYISALYAKPI